MPAFQPFQPFGNPLVPTVRAAAPDEPAFDPTEEEGFWERIGGGFMSGLQWVGETLDKPGRAIRGLLAGRPSELANLIPFSDTAGLTDPQQATSGRDLLEQAGILNANTEGLDWGDVGGFAAEVLLDPFIFLGGPALRGAAKGATLAKKAVHSTPEAIQAIKSGEAGLLHAGIPFMPSTRKAFNLGLSPETAGKIAETVAYSWPVRQVRGTFSAIPGVGRTMGKWEKTTDKLGQQLADANWLKMQDSTAKIFEDTWDMHAAMEKANLSYQGHMKEFIERGDAPAAEDFGRSLAEVAVQTPEGMFQRARQLFARAEVDPAALQAIVDDYVPLIERGWNLQKVWKGRLEELGVNIDELGEDFLGHWFRGLGESALTDPIRGIRAANTSFAPAIRRLEALRDEDLAGVIPGSGKAPWLLSPETRNLPASQLAALGMERPGIVVRGTTLIQAMSRDPRVTAINFVNHGLDKKVTEIQKAILKDPANEALRVELTRAQDMQTMRDAFLVEKGGGKMKAAPGENIKIKPGVELDEAGEEVGEGFAHVIDEIGGKGPIGHKGPERLVGPKKITPEMQLQHLTEGYGLSAEKAQEVADYLGGLSYETLKDGLFNRTLMRDAVDYAERAAGTLAGIHTALSSLAKNSVHGGSGIPLKTFITMSRRDGGLGLSDKAVDVVMERIGKFAAEDPSIANKAIASIDELVVPDNIRGSLTKVVQAHAVPEQVAGPIGKFMDKFNATFKSWVTVPFPAFHTRNLISALYSNWVDGMFSFKDSWEVTKWLKNPSDSLMVEGHDVLEIAKQFKMLGHGVMADIANATKEATFTGLGGPARTLARGFAGAVKDPKSLLTSPFRVPGGFAAGQTNAVIQAGSETMHMAEAVARLAPLMTLLKKGWSPAEAARKVMAAQFDYSSLSDTDRWLKRVIPFWSFTRKNLPRQVKLLATQPGGATAQTIRATNVLREEHEPGVVPRYLSEGLLIPLGGPPRAKNYFTSSEFLPHEEAFNQFTFFQGKPDFKRMGEKFLGNLHPIIQTPLQLITGRQFWSGRKLSELHQFPFENAPVANTLAAQAPWTRFLSTISTLKDPRKSGLEKASNVLIGGARVTTVDEEKQKAAEARDILERILSEHPQVRQFIKPYVPKALKESGEADPEILEKLKLLDQVLNRSAELRETAP